MRTTRRMHEKSLCWQADSSQFGYTVEPPGEVLKNFDAQVTHAALLNQNLWDDTQSKTFLNAPG